MDKLFKVVKIIDEYHIVINAGERDNIKVGNKFEIFSEEGSVVKDPDTGEILGNLDAIKDVVTVQQVKEKMCICGKMTAPLFPSINLYNERILSELPVEVLEISGGNVAQDKIIHVGDFARNVSF